MCLSSIHRDLSNLISQFFLLPLPDPRSGWIATTANVSAQELDLDDDDGVEGADCFEGVVEGKIEERFGLEVLTGRYDVVDALLGLSVFF